MVEEVGEKVLENFSDVTLAKIVTFFLQTIRDTADESVVRQLKALHQKMK